MSESTAPAVKPLDNADRAAIILLCLGEELAGNVLKYLNPKDVQKVGVAMTNLREVPKDMVMQVLKEFTREAEGHIALGAGSEEYLRKMLTGALGETKANSLLDRILLGRHSKGLETLKLVDARVVAETVRNEHPQVVAIVLSHLEPKHAAEVMAYLPENIWADLMLRISSLEAIHPAAIEELDEILDKQFAGKINMNSSNVGGVKTAADILNFMETAAEEKILETIRETNEPLSVEIQDLMFVFEDLASLDDRGIQALLREVSTENLIVALKGADIAIRDKIFNNMSKRASETMRDDLEAKGPVRLSEVEAAQREILATARRMADAGELVLGSKGGEEYV